MTPARWDKVKELFEAALDRPVPDRAQFIQRQSDIDSELKRHISELLANHLEAERFLEGPIEPAYSLPAGSVLCARFEILRPLGKGGMGEVYQARDRELGEPVALKILHRDLARSSDSIARLRKEIQLARKITHTNVCRVFDVNRDVWGGTSLLFITMELLDGETLRERLKRDIPAAEALEIARQIAAGLDAAHRSGIIHRDLKSANVMLTPVATGVRAVITDFGLAQSIPGGEAKSSITATGWMVGTPAYMAPEQLEGGDATLASDVYSFGVVLRELRTHSASRANEAGQAPKSKIEIAWAGVIEQCLARDPASRPASAGKAVRKIQRLSRLIRWWPTAAAIALSLALMLAGLRFYWQRPVQGGGATVMLAKFENLSGDARLDGMTGVFRLQLRQSSHFGTWDYGRIPAALARMALPAETEIKGDLWRQVAVREKVPFLLTGSLAPLGGEYVLNLRLEEIRSGSPYPGRSWSFSPQASNRTAVLEALHEGALWVRKQLGERGEQIARSDSLPQDITSSSWDAISSFEAGETAEKQQQPERALALFQQAVAFDPEFALAHIRMGDVFISLQRQKEGFEAWRAALADSAKRRLSRYEELRLRGQYEADLTEFQLAEAAFAQMENEFPKEYLGAFYLADAMRWQGRLQEAVSHLLIAEQRRPDSVAVQANLARAYLMLHRFGELSQKIEKLRALGASGAADRFAAMNLFAAGRYPEALDYAVRETNSGDPAEKSRGFAVQGALLAELGRAAEAQQVLATGIQFDNEAGFVENRAAKQIGIAYLLFRANDFSGARRFASSAAVSDGSLFTLLRAAVVLSRSGFSTEALRLRDQAHQIAPGARLTNYVEARIEGEVALAGLRFVEAGRAFDRAAQLEPPIRPREYQGRALADSPLKSMILLQDFVDKPDLLWQAVEYDFPGFLTDSLLEYVKAAIAAEQPDAASRGLQVFLSRRGASESAEVRNAQQLLRKLQ